MYQFQMNSYGLHLAKGRDRSRSTPVQLVEEALEARQIYRDIR